MSKFTIEGEMSTSLDINTKDFVFLLVKILKENGIHYEGCIDTYKAKVVTEKKITFMY